MRRAVTDVGDTGSSTRLRIWGSGVRISSGAPDKWLIYIYFLIRSHNRRRLAETKIATTSPPGERDRTRRFPVAHRVRLSRQAHSRSEDRSTKSRTCSIGMSPPSAMSVRALKLKSRRQQQVLLPALLLPGGLRLPNGLRRAGNSYFIDSIRAMDL